MKGRAIQNRTEHGYLPAAAVKCLMSLCLLPRRLRQETQTVQQEYPGVGLI